MKLIDHVQVQPGLCVERPRVPGPLVPQVGVLDGLSRTDPGNSDQRRHRETDDQSPDKLEHELLAAPAAASGCWICFVIVAVSGRTLLGLALPVLFNCSRCWREPRVAAAPPNTRENPYFCCDAVRCMLSLCLHASVCCVLFNY